MVETKYAVKFQAIQSGIDIENIGKEEYFDMRAIRWQRIIEMIPHKAGNKY